MDASPGREAPSGLDASESRILNPRPFRAVRRAPSAAEATAGAVVILLLAFVAVWVAWRGAHPEPGLLADASLVTATGRNRAGQEARRGTPSERSASDRAAAALAERATEAPGAGGGAAGNGALPAGLAGDGWTAGPVARFDASSLWERIDGRADFFLSRGFRSLTAVTLSGPSGAGIDVEVYALGAPDDALGALAAEKTPEAVPRIAGDTTSYLVRNALFLACGSSYVRALGSDESTAVLEGLERVRAAFAAGKDPSAPGAAGAAAARGRHDRG